MKIVITVLAICFITVLVKAQSDTIAINTNESKNIDLGNVQENIGKSITLLVTNNNKFPIDFLRTKAMNNRVIVNDNLYRGQISLQAGASIPITVLVDKWSQKLGNAHDEIDITWLYGESSNFHQKIGLNWNLDHKEATASSTPPTASTFAKTQKHSIDYGNISESKTLELGNFEENTEKSITLLLTNNYNTPLIFSNDTRVSGEAMLSSIGVGSTVKAGEKIPVTISFQQWDIKTGNKYDEIDITWHYGERGFIHQTIGFNRTVYPKGTPPPPPPPTSPAITADEKKCIDFIDMCMKECNGGIITDMNHKQILGSYDGYDLNVKIDAGQLGEDANYKRKKQYTVKNIQWGRLYNTNVHDLTFQYSCITIAFVDGFGVDVDRYSQYGEFFRTDQNVSHFSIIVKQERVKECINMIYRLSDLAVSKLPTPSAQLTKKEEWIGGGLLLVTYFIDQNGLKQGRYEGRNKTGLLVTYGNYKDNAKTGQWMDFDGGGNEGMKRSSTGMYKNGHRVGSWGNNGSIYDRDGHTSGSQENVFYSCGDF